MMLDRIIIKEGSNLFKLQEENQMEIFANNKISSGFLSTIFPSDHFGLKIRLNFN